MPDRRSLTMYQFLTLVLLGALLGVGFFHYKTLNTGQLVLAGHIATVQVDLQEVRNEYVRLREYVSGQQKQDAEIKQIKSDLEAIKKEVRNKKGIL